MNEPKMCDACGAAIPGDAPGGVCPACLLGAGLGAAEVSPEPFDRDELTRLFPQFEIEAFVGEGGMGVVYRARQKSLDRTVALKILPPKVAAAPGFAERFTREAKALATLNHPNIVAVYEAGRVEDLYFLAMEYVDGVNLRQAQKGGHLSPEQAFAIVPQICDALQYAHDEGVVHRDIKPENILLDRNGRVKIADFGLAKLLRSDPASFTLTGTEQIMGTLHYIAPEQMRTPQEVDHRADIYSLGVVFYEMLTGDLPIGRFPMPSEKVEVDVRLDEVVLRALERERDRRYQHVSEVKTNMETIASTPAVEVQPREETGRPVVQPSPDHTRLSALAVAGILCWPLALLTGLLTVGIGVRDEIGVWAGVSVAITGFILSIIAHHSIKREPDRLHGRGLAKFGILAPLVLAALSLVGILVVAKVYQVRSQRRSAERVEQAAAQEALEARAHELLAQVVSFGGLTPMEDIANLVDPRRREWFESLSGEEFRERFEKAELGLAMIDLTALPAPLEAFRIHEVSRNEDRAFVELRTGRHVITYSMVLVDGEWYLEICPLGFRFPELQGRELGELRRQVDRLILPLPREPTHDDLELILPAVDPARHAYLRGLTAEEFEGLQAEHELGAAFLSASALPAGTWDLSSSAGQVKVEGGTGTYTRWRSGAESGVNHRVTFPIVRTNGRWYLAVGPVEIVEIR